MHRISCLLAAVILSLNHFVQAAPAFAQQQTASANTQPAAAADSTKLTVAVLGERLAALEERVLGLEHPLDSLFDRTCALEREVFGGAKVNDLASVNAGVILVQRICLLESAIYAKASKGYGTLPDGMSTFVEPK